MSASVSHLTDATFSEEVNGAAEPVLVDFWAEWCGPCKTIAPMLEELADEQAGRLRVAKVNVDENQAVARQHAVQSLPTLVVFRDGVEVKRVIGARSKAKLLEDLADVI